MPKRPRTEPANPPSGQPSREAPRHHISTPPRIGPSAPPRTDRSVPPRHDRSAPPRIDRSAPPRIDRSAPPRQLSRAQRVPVSAEGNIVAAADDGGRVRIFSFDDGADGSCKLDFKAGTRAVFGLAFLGGGVVAGVFGNGKVRTWLAATGTEIECIKLDKGCTAVAKLDDKSFVVSKEMGDLVFVSHSGGRDLRILFEASTGLDEVSNICVHGEVVVVSKVNVVVGVWRAMKYSRIVLIGDDPGYDKAVAVDERFVIISSRRCTRIFDCAENFTLLSKVLHESPSITNVRRLAFVGEGLLLMVSQLWDGELLFRFEKPSNFLLAPIHEPFHLMPGSGFRTAVRPEERYGYSLVLTSNGRIACVEAGAARATGIMPPGPVAAAGKAYLEVLHSPKPRVAELAGLTPVKQGPASRANVKIEPTRQRVVPIAKSEGGYQVPVQQEPVSRNPVKQEPGRELDSQQEPTEACCIDLEDGLGSDLKSLKAVSSQPAQLEAMSVDAICDVLAGVMISFEETFRDHVPLLSSCLRRVLRQNLIAADSIVNFPEAKLFAMIQSTLGKDEAYGKLSQNVADNFEWRLQRFLHQLRC